MDKDFLQKEQRLFEDWLSHQLPAVERRKYPIPTAVKKRPPPVENGPELTCAERWRRIEADTGADEDQRRRDNADVISTSGVTRGDPAINSAFKREDVRADRTPALHDGQDVSYLLSKFEDNGFISDASTNSAVIGTSAVRTKEEASATEDSAITEGDLEECSEQVLRDDQPVIDGRAKFEVIRPSIVAEVNSAMSTMTSISAGINHVVTANSALEDPAVKNELGAVPVCHKTADYANVVNSAMGTPKTCIIQSAAVDLASADLNAESDSDVATASRQDVSYTGDEFAFREVSSAVSMSSADQHSDATEYYDGREGLLLEGIKPNDDPATVDSALGTLDAENCTGTEIGVTSSATTVFDPGGIGYSLEQSGDGETSWRSKTVTEPVPAELSWEDEEYSSTGDRMKTLRQHYLAIAATEDEQEDDVDSSKTDIFERSRTDLELTDYAHELPSFPTSLKWSLQNPTMALQTSSQRQRSRLGW
ncbi:hypothetical protein PInf_023350 [Phytophthora infestans]|nr:hypothetical protein PInf_023350 [Phytophthora infestans]